MIEIMRKIMIILWLNFVIFGVIGSVPRKLNGDFARTEEFPFQVSVVYLGNHHVCSASIITNFHALTTASCITFGSENVMLSNIRIFTHNAHNNDDDDDAKFHEVKLVIYHPQYKIEELWKNDIAILRLTKKISFNSSRKPVKLPSQIFNVKNRLAVSGWRMPIEHGYYFQRLDVIGLSRTDCLKYYQEFINFARGQSCLTSNSGMTSEFVHGDSGNPVTRTRTNLIGIVSLIPKHPSFPVIYTKVCIYNNWIFNKINHF